MRMMKWFEVGYVLEHFESMLPYPSPDSLSTVGFTALSSNHWFLFSFLSLFPLSDLNWSMSSTKEDYVRFWILSAYGGSRTMYAYCSFNYWWMRKWTGKEDGRQSMSSYYPWRARKKSLCPLVPHTSVIGPLCVAEARHTTLSSCFCVGYFLKCYIRFFF